MLQLAGIESGEVQGWNEDNPRGNRENAEVSKLNDSVLQRNQANWQQPFLPDALTSDDALRIERSRILDKLAFRARPFMFKDPRTLLTLPFWREAIPNSRRIGIFRHPVRVSQSLYLRNKTPLVEGFSLWLTYNRALLAEHARAPFPIVCFDLPHEDFLASVVAAVRAECGDWVDQLAVDLAAMGAFYSAELVHHQDSELLEEFVPDAEGQATLGEALLLYGQLCALAGVDAHVAGESCKVETDAFRQLLRADRALEAGSFDLAVRLYRAAISASPNARSIWDRLIKLLLQVGPPEDMLQACDDALERFPQDREFLLMSAAANRKAGHAESATQMLKRVFDTYPDSLEAWIRKGEWLCDDGQWDEGVVALRHSIVLDPPGHFWAHARIGDALIRRGFREEGEVSFKNALVIAPDTGRAAVHHRFSDALMAHGDSIAALCHQKLASTLSNEAYIHVEYAQLLRRLGKMSEASIHILKARERGIDSPALRALLEQITATISH